MERSERISIQIPMMECMKPTSVSANDLLFGPSPRLAGSGCSRCLFGVYRCFLSEYDGSSTERLQLQWGEQAACQISRFANQGWFRLRMGNEVSAAITPVYTANSFNALSTGRAIQTALSSMPGIGVGNVKVSSYVVQFSRHGSISCCIHKGQGANRFA